jgi:hypothetical protein
VTAATGLTPVVFATEQVAVEADGEWWWEYYLDAPSRVTTPESLCVLRIHQRDVTSSTGHTSLRSAMADAHGAATDVGA